MWAGVASGVESPEIRLAYSAFAVAARTRQLVSRPTFAHTDLIAAKKFVQG